jgi:hypothetical protein
MVILHKSLQSEIIVFALERLLDSSLLSGFVLKAAFQILMGGDSSQTIAELLALILLPSSIIIPIAEASV